MTTLRPQAPAGRDGATTLLLAGLSAVWGTSFLLIKISDSAISPAWVAAARLAFGAAFVALVAKARREAAVRGARRWAHLALLAFFANAAPFVLLAWAETRVPSGLAGVMNATTPLWTMLLVAAALPQERLGLGEVAWMLAAFAGVVGVLSPWSAPRASLLGDAACLVAAASYGVGFVYTRAVVERWGLPATSLTAAQLALAAAEAMAAVPLLGSRLRLEAGPIAAVVVLGVLNTGAAFVAYHVVVRRAGPTRSSTVTYLSPVIALALGVALRGERLGWGAYAGTALLLASLAGAQRQLRQARAARRSLGDAAGELSAAEISPARPGAGFPES